MQTLRTSDYPALDCNAEFTVQNLLHVRKLVEEADAPNLGEALAYCAKIERLIKKTVSEVEPPTTNQHLASNIV